MLLVAENYSKFRLRARFSRPNYIYIRITFNYALIQRRVNIHREWQKRKAFSFVITCIRINVASLFACKIEFNDSEIIAISHYNGQHSARSFIFNF